MGHCIYRGWQKSQGAGGWLILQGQRAWVTQCRLSPHLWGMVTGKPNADKASNESGPGSANKFQPGAKGCGQKPGWSHSYSVGPKSIQEPGPETEWTQAEAFVQGTHWEDELPTAQVLGPPRRQDQKHPHTHSIAQAENWGLWSELKWGPPTPMRCCADCWGLLVPSGAW